MKPKKTKEKIVQFTENLFLTNKGRVFQRGFNSRAGYYWQEITPDLNLIKPTK